MVSQSSGEASNELALDTLSLNEEVPLDSLSSARPLITTNQQIIGHSGAYFRSTIKGESPLKRRRIAPSLSELTSGLSSSVTRPNQDNDEPDISLSSSLSPFASPSSLPNPVPDGISISSPSLFQKKKGNESPELALCDLDLSPVPTSDHEEEQEGILTKSTWNSTYWKNALYRREDVEQDTKSLMGDYEQSVMIELEPLPPSPKNRALVSNQQPGGISRHDLLQSFMFSPTHSLPPAHDLEWFENEVVGPMFSDVLSLSPITAPRPTPPSASIIFPSGLPSTSNLFIPDLTKVTIDESLLVDHKNLVAAKKPSSSMPSPSVAIDSLSVPLKPDGPVKDKTGTIPLVVNGIQTNLQAGPESSPSKFASINPSSPTPIVSKLTVSSTTEDPHIQRCPSIPTELAHTQKSFHIPSLTPSLSILNEESDGSSILSQSSINISKSDVTDQPTSIEPLSTLSAIHTADLDPSAPDSGSILLPSQSPPIIESTSAGPSSPVGSSNKLLAPAMTDAEVAAFLANTTDEPPGKRNLRQRTSLQLQPYTRERLAYKQRLAMRGFKDALLGKEDEADQLRKDKISRKNKDKDMNGKDSLGGWLEEEGDDLLDMLEVGEETWTPGVGEVDRREEQTAETEDGERKQGDTEDEDADDNRVVKRKEKTALFGGTSKSKRTYARRKVRERTPMHRSHLTGQITPGGNPNLRAMHASNTILNPEESQNFDFTAFGIDASHAQEDRTASPSLTAPRRSIRFTSRRNRRVLEASDADSNLTSDSESHSDSHLDDDESKTLSSSSSSSSSQEATTMILERKKQKILNRMMPAVLAKKHLQYLAKDKADRKALKRAARHVAKIPEGPLRAGQSVVRRTVGATKRPFVIEGDSESSAEEEQAPMVVEQVRHRQLDVILNRDVVDPALVNAIYGTSGELLPETDDEESNLDEDEDRAGYFSDEAVEFASNDIRRWIGMPSKQAESVVDRQLSRTAVRSRNSAERAQRLSAQPHLSRLNHSNIKRTDPPRAALNKTKSRKKASRPAARRKIRPTQVFLDDDSIFGDFQPPPRPAGPTGESLLRRKTRRAGIRVVPAVHARGSPQPHRPNPPIVVRPLSPGLVGQGNDSPVHTPTSHRVFARHSSASSVPFEFPTVDRGDGQSSPKAASPGPRVLWDTYAGFSTDFGITPLPAGLAFPSLSYSRQGYLSELLDLCQIFYLHQEGQSSKSILAPPPCSAFDLELTADMPLSLFSEAFGLIVNRLYDAVDPDSQLANHDDIDAQTKVQLTCERAMRFTCLFVMHRRSDDEYVDIFFPAIMDGIESLLERLETMTTPTSLKHIRSGLFFRLHWFLLELATRFALSSPILIEQIRDSQQSLCSILVRRLLEYDFSRTIRSVKTASSSLTGANEYRPDVQDLTIELWASLIHLCPYMDLDFPQGPSFWIAVKAGLQATGIISSGLLAAEKIWYVIQGVCCISQFNRRGITEDTPFILAYWPLVSEAVLSVKLEADSTYDAEASSSNLKKRDKYVWTVLSRCYLLGVRWGWPLNAKDPILGQLGQKVFKTRKFLNLFSDPIVSDFPLFIRESNRSLISEVDPSVDSAFHVFIKIIALAVRDTQKSSSQGELTTKQAEREISRLLAISAPMGKVSFTRSCPPSMRELSTLINRYSFSIVSVLLDPAEATAVHSLRQMRNYLAFEVADFKSRKICIRAMMYMAVLHRHLNLSLQSVAHWLGDLADVLLQELSIIDRPPGVVRLGSPTAPKHELIFCLSLILGSVRHIISSPIISIQNRTGHSKTPYPDPVLLHKSWTEGILASPLALEPLTGLEVLRCVQAFLDARRSALSYLHTPPPNPAGDSQDEFGAEFADIDMNDPTLLLLLDGPSAKKFGESSEATVARSEETMDEKFASTVNQIVSPAIYKLLSNMVVDDQAWVQLVGERGSEVSREEDSRARDSYVAQLVDCWSGCASVLVQHGLKDWSSYVELGTESWKRFSESATKRQIGLRFMWNLAQLNPSSYEHLKEHFLSVWFQSIVAPASTFTVEPHYTSLLFQMDKLDDIIFFQLPIERNEHGIFEFDSEKLQAQRLDILNEIFRNLHIELSRNAFGNTSLLQRKSYLMSCVRDMLLSMADHVTKMQGTAAGNNYTIFCWDVIARLKNRAELVINERTMRELTFFNTLSVVS
ncbi:Methyl methanesulphonate-sensitivity protein 22 [Phaffia rhodozyma]|uniref:Methyl methanesulphonate-sensitivity protein 22 n=1 Tax=Phaffia rhodozyma TaxID=264483 RepID=A0A0F7SVP1_PHARH|nr:Methyl methanesulphonate-sensitivity protein 22 [Phaffia rhodozyma]